MIVDSAVRLHADLGPGLLESAYKRLLARQLRRRGLRVERERPMPLAHDGIRIEGAFYADLLVAESVVVEAKSVERLAPVHTKQVFTYLRLLDLPLGFLINFGAWRAADGIRRIVNYQSTRADELHFRPRTTRS